MNRHPTCRDSVHRTRLSTLQAWVFTRCSQINSFFSSTILIFHKYFVIKDTFLSLNPSGLHFVHPGLDCRRPCIGAVTRAHAYVRAKFLGTADSVESAGKLQAILDIAPDIARAEVQSLLLFLLLLGCSCCYSINW